MMQRSWNILKDTLEDMPVDENCIETPLSQLVQWPS